MARYEVVMKIVYVLVVEAENEEEADKIATDTETGAYEQVDVEFEVLCDTPVKGGAGTIY